MTTSQNAWGRLAEYSELDLKNIHTMFKKQQNQIRLHLVHTGNKTHSEP